MHQLFPLHTHITLIPQGCSSPRPPTPFSHPRFFSQPLESSPTFSLPPFPLPSLLLYTFSNLTIFLIPISPMGTSCSFSPPLSSSVKINQKIDPNKAEDRVGLCFLDMGVSPILVSHELDAR